MSQLWITCLVAEDAPRHSLIIIVCIIFFFLVLVFGHMYMCYVYGEGFKETAHLAAELGQKRAAHSCALNSLMRMRRGEH